MLLKWLVCVAVFNFFTVPVFSNEGSRKKRSDENVPCDEGWHNFREKCFQVSNIGDKVSWEKAEDRCTELGGNLATIQSKEENDFVVAFLLLDVRDVVWIGINDRRSEGEYVWDDGSVVNYTNWRENQPSGMRDGEEDCGEMTFWPEHGYVGTWNDAACHLEFSYICQKKADHTKSSPNPKYCPSEEGGGLKFNGACYHVITATKIWDEAEQFCANNFKGHLAWVYDMIEDLYLDHVLSTLNKAFWVGVKMKDNVQQKWTSNWFVAYNGVIEDTGDYKPGACVLRTGYKAYTTVSCTRRYSFICKETKAQPIVLKPPPKGSRCPGGPHDWRDLGGEFCYFVETKNMVTFSDASFDCSRRGGNLVSIHSAEERDTLFPFIRYTGDTVYIGAIRDLKNEDNFIWMDHTPMDFTFWKPGEPNWKDEKCTEAFTHTMQWNDVKCDGKKGYICSVRKVFPKTISTIGTTECLCNGSQNPVALFGKPECTEEYICYVRLSC